MALTTTTTRTLDPRLSAAARELTPDTITRLRLRWAAGVPFRRLCAEFGMSRPVLSRIIHGHHAHARAIEGGVA